MRTFLNDDTKDYDYDFAYDKEIFVFRSRWLYHFFPFFAKLSPNSSLAGLR